MKVNGVRFALSTLYMPEIWGGLTKRAQALLAQHCACPSCALSPYPPA
jgi:hypothetical protein